MKKFVTPAYTRDRIRAASEVLRDQVASLNAETIEIFRIAHNWRSSHVYPMTRVRYELGGRMRSVANGGKTAARLKRMSSIRKKLSAKPNSMSSIQDIAGCRAILKNMIDANALVALYLSGRGSRHRVVNKSDYFANPKVGGYRSYHLVVEFRPTRESEGCYRNHKVEIQIRTQLQHAWATAVEAVGLVRGEDMKGGSGNPDWLRFFELMAAEFAYEEGYPLNPNVPMDRRERVGELRRLEQKLKAIERLESYKEAIDAVTYVRSAGQKYFLVSFEYIDDEATVSVTPFSENGAADLEYIMEEMTSPGRTTVLVELEKAADLREAYPNYFLDVTMFLNRAKKLLRSMPDVSWINEWVQS